MALKNKIHFDIDTLEQVTDTQGQAIDTLEGQATAADEHIADLNNPHQVTAAQIGAVTQGELENAITAVVEDLDWKEMVPTFEDLAITYADAVEGWTASVAADNLIYRYDGTNWVPIIGGTTPLATANNDGLLSKEDFTKLGGIAAGAQPDQDAADVPFDNQDTNLIATNVQGALEELELKKLDATALAGTLALYATDQPSSVLEPSFRLVSSITDPAYPVNAVNINTPAIVGQNQPVGQLVSDPGVIIGNPGVITISTIGQIRKITGNQNQNATFYYEVYRYDGILEELEEEPIATSDVTPVVRSTSYEQFFAFAVFNNGVFGPEDRIVIRYFADQVENSGAVYQFQFGGENPVRTLFPVPVEVIPTGTASNIVVNTANFDTILSNSDTTIQQALETLDKHDHDNLYYTKEELRPLSGEPAADDLQTPAELDGRYIKTNAINDTVQPFNANTVVDANYNNFNPSGTYPNLRAQATTKGDVDLGNVLNYTVANQSEAEAGLVNNKYMTPLRTKEAILSLSPPVNLSGVEGRLDVIEGSGAGSITKALNDAKDYTDAEILAAQLNLGNNYSVATIAERNALQNLAVGDIVFVADDGDGKWAQYKVTVVEPLAFLKVMDQDIFLNALSAADIKAAYESNPDTNAFTDASLSSLNLLTAQVPAISGALINNISNTNSNTARIEVLEDAGEAPRSFVLSGELDNTEWGVSGVSGAVENTAVFGSLDTTIEDVDFQFNFEIANRDVAFNDFSNLPPQEMEFSSTSTTGPVTLTKLGGGGFTDKFIGAQVWVQETVNNEFIRSVYLVTDVVDQNTLTVFFQDFPGFSSPLVNTTQGLFTGNNSLIFFFTFNNGRGGGRAVIQSGSFEEQTSTVINKASIIKSGAIRGNIEVPQGAQLAGVQEYIFDVLDPGSSIGGNRFYALIYDNTVAYVSKPNGGIRKIAKIEDNLTYINFAGNYEDEDWQQAGGSLQFITGFAIESSQQNQVSAADWEQATEFLSLQGVNTITYSVGLSVDNDNQIAFSEGLVLSFATENGNIFTTEDNVIIDLEIDANNFVIASNLEGEWSKVKYGEIIANNTIRFYAEEAPTTDLPLQVKVVR